MTGNSLACFIVTYERTDFILQTIQAIVNQDLKPSKILIVDNSESDGVQNLVRNCIDSQVEVIKIGNNLGPAGAAKIALEKLTQEGYKWIYWGDDDDPPLDPQIFSLLMEISTQKSNAGIVGKVGGRFIANRARTRVVLNREIKAVTEADYVTGGKHMMVSSEVIKSGILPNPNLFFGFEELEFCLRAKDAGFAILVDGQGILMARKKAGNTSSNYKWRGKSIGDLSRINRQYYSVRNMLYILWSRGEYLGYFYFLIKSLFKIPFSLKYGFYYFRKLSGLYCRAIFHHLIGRYGQYIPTR